MEKTKIRRSKVDLGSPEKINKVVRSCEILPDHPIEVRSRVKFFGEDIGFQFSSSGMGSGQKTVKVKNIRLATDEDIELLERNYIDSIQNRNKGDRTAKRKLPINSDIVKVYMGESQFKFKDEEDPRRVKVFGMGWFGEMPEKWESYEHIGDE